MLVDADERIFKDRAAVEADQSAIAFLDRFEERSVYQQLTTTAKKFSTRPAVSFQLKSGPQDKSTTIDWQRFHGDVTRAANLFRELGVEDEDAVAILLPNCIEGAIATIGAMTAGRVAPINPLQDAEQIGGLLRDGGAKVLVTLAPFPKTDLAQLAHNAMRYAPGVKTVIEVDLLDYLSPPLKWLVPFLRPKLDEAPDVKRVGFKAALAEQPDHALTFQEFVKPDGSQIGATFHTGGTTGRPKLAQHPHMGMLYNGWLTKHIMLSEEDVMLCPLPLFHVFAAYPILTACIVTGAHMVMVTPQGYRGDGVFDNFWKLIERWGTTFMVTVPTAAAALMQRPVDANVSTLKYALCGSAPLPLDLFNQFQLETGVKILEGYGMTECTCLLSVNPPFGERKVGSVGLAFPYTDVEILECDEAGNILKKCEIDEIGEICVNNPGVLINETYTDPERNKGMFVENRLMRTGDLGRIDADGYVWITGRAKDLIIRGGHNIDPAEIEESLTAHPAVSLVGAIGQPDKHSGELPCAYVELVEGAEVSTDELIEWAREHIHERAAIPKYVELLPEMPKTAVGKIFKPELRKMSMVRVYGQTLQAAGIDASIEVVEDKKLGLVAELTATGEKPLDDNELHQVLGGFARPFRVVG